MTAILFDATTYRNASMGFGEGLLPAPAPAFDDMGNRVPRVHRTVADELWYASDLQRRMDEQSERDDAVRQMLEEADWQWLMALELGRGPITDYDVAPHGRV